MRRIHQRQLRYGIPTGVFVFGLLWLISLMLLPENNGNDIERWRESLWLLLGMHFIDIAATALGVLVIGKIDAANYFQDLPVGQLRFLPPLLIAVGAYYTGRSISRTRRPKYIFVNAAAILYGYVPALALAIVVSDIQPGTESAVFLFLFVLAAIYVGSSLLGALTGGLPFIGIVSLGTIILLGAILLIFGLGLLIEFSWTILSLCSGVAGGATLLFSQRTMRAPADIAAVIARYKYPILLFIVLLAALSLALSGAGSIPTDPGGLLDTEDSHEGDFSTNRTETFIQDGVNDYRDDHGERRLQWDSRLARQARAHARDMAANGYYDHSPEDHYYCGGGENIFRTWYGEDVQQPDGSSEYMGSESAVANATVNEWHHSRGHRDIMLDSHQHSGVGVAIADDGTVYIAMAYC